MNCIVLLYLFCLASVSNDVISQASTPSSIWQCYSKSNPCGFSSPAGPAIRSECCLVTAEDLPSEIPVSIDKLLSRILVPESGVTYGLVVLEAGNSSYVEWQLSSRSSSFPITSHYETNRTTIQEAFVRNLTIYHIDAAAYEGTPDEVFVIAPGGFLSFIRKELSRNSSLCYHTALIVAPLKWTTEIAQEFTRQFNRITVSECKSCVHLPLSSDFIRLCPSLQSGAIVEAPVNIAITSLIPTYWNAFSSSQTFEATLNTTQAKSSISRANCSLLSINGNYHPLSVELTPTSILRMTLSHAVEPNVFSLTCSFKMIGQNTIFDTEYAQEVVGMNFTSLVEIERGSIALPCQKNGITVEAKFKLPLPSVFLESGTGGSYCYIGNGTYLGNFKDLLMSCYIFNLTINHDTDTFFVRSRTLHNITMREQIPIRLQFTCAKTTSSPVSPNLRAIISRDLLGFVVDSDTFDVFSVGQIPCHQVILEHNTLGKEAVCVGVGDHVAVKFGDTPTINVGDTLTILGQNVKLDKPALVSHPNFTISAPSEVMACIDEVDVEVKQITGDGNRSLRYEWKAKNASTELMTVLAKATERTVSFPAKMLTSETVIVVTGCNFVNMCTKSDEILLRPVTSDATLSLTLGGVSQVLLPSSAVRLRAIPVLTRCNASLDVVPNDAQYNWYLDGTFVTNDDSYRIPAYTYQAGDSVDVLIEVNYKDSTTNQHLKATVEEKLTYVAGKLVATIDAVSRCIASDAPTIIDASRSANPNDRDGSVTHEWSCWNTTSVAECDLPAAVETKLPILRIPPRILNQGMSFNFTDHIRAMNLSIVIWSFVSIGPPKLPQISFSPLTMDRVSTGDYVSLIVILFKMTLISCFFNLSSFLTNLNTLFTEAQMSESNQASVSLTIPPANPKLYPNWIGLLAGMHYCIRLNACSADGCSFADVPIFVNAPPTLGLVDVVPARGASALNTQIEFRVGDGWLDEDQPLEYRFGLKVLNVDNTSESYWFPRTGASSYRIYLPSAQSNHPSCNKRVGFQGLLEVCDIYLSCSTAETETFEVSPPRNLTVATVDMVAVINSYVGNGNVFSALSTMYALDVQKCEEDLDVVTADKITTKLLMTLDEDSDSNDYKEVLASASRLMNVVTPPVLASLIDVLEEYRTFLGMTSASTSRRTKRAAAMTTTITSDEQEANDMLKMYDLLLEKNQAIVEVYLLNIKDFLGTFCLQLDVSSSRIMKAQGYLYTSIQAQSLAPGSEKFLTTSYTLAGEDVKAVTFTNEFAARFASWHCGSSLVVCQNICLATSQIKMTAVFKNDQLMEHLFGNMYEAVTINKSASQLYQIGFLDPLSGSSVPLPLNIIQYSVYVPLTSYQSSNYYACLLFIGKIWDESKCLTSNFAKRFDGVDHIHCRCSSAGVLSVFIKGPPVPLALPDHNEIRITFHLSTGTVSTSTQQSLFVSHLATASRVDESRFVNTSAAYGSANSSQISITLRPPFRATQMSNSYAVQAIQRAVQAGSGFKAYDSVTVGKSNYSVVRRDLNGDGNARKVVITIYRSFQSVVGNDTTAVTNKWSESIANMLRVSVYRFKNAKIYLGIVFNVTITLPFEDEKIPLSAEEIALMMMECSLYHEFDLQSNQGETLLVEKITNNEIVELIVDQQLSTLVLVLIIVISTVLVFTSLYVGGAVVVKVRTDRLVEEDRRRMVRIEPPQPPPVPPPQYTQTVAPASKLSERYPDHRLRNVVKAHHA